MGGNFLGIVRSRQSLRRSQSSKGAAAKATMKYCLPWLTRIIVTLSSSGSRPGSFLRCRLLPVRRSVATSSFLTRVEPVMGQWARERMDAAGWLLVHSIADTGAVCTASSLVTTPVLTFTTSRCPVALPTANKGWKSAQFLTVRGGHILTVRGGCGRHGRRADKPKEGVGALF